MLLNKRISIWYFVNQIKFQIVLIICFAIVVGFLDTHPWLEKVSVPLPVVAILGTAVSLLLTFRTSQSYDRWWEARKVWGAIVNDSRTFIRQIIQFLPENNNDIIKEFSERQVIWTLALGESLRKQPFSERVQSFISGQNIEAANISNAILDEHSRQIAKLVKQGKLSEFQAMQLNTTLGNLCNSMGMCERIKNTVFPRSYSLLLHTLIYVFTLLLPFSLDDSKIAVEIVLTTLLPVIFISIEKTAIIMQDPFENTPVDIPVTTLAQTIETNLMQMIGEKTTTNKNNDNSYYIM